MKRRRFLFWLGFGLFSLSDKLRIAGFDRLAEAAMRLADPATESETSSSNSSAASAAMPSTSDSPPPEHWTANENNSWRWFERENYADGQWKLTGITTPINKDTGEHVAGRTGYLDEELVPTELRAAKDPAFAGDVNDHTLDASDHQPDTSRRARHGLPPSKWLRSLHADEIRIWLRKIDPPEAGVEGMTYWTHLTRDHFFDPVKIAGLTIDEQAKLHAAAHYGY